MVKVFLKKKKKKKQQYGCQLYKIFQKMKTKSLLSIKKAFHKEKYKKFLIFELGKFHFVKYKKFFRVFLSWSINNFKYFFWIFRSWNIRNFYRGEREGGRFRFLKVLTSRAKKFNFQKYKDFFLVDFLIFF